MKNKKIKIIFGIVLIFLFLLIEYKYRVETTKYELSGNEKYYLICYDYSGKAEKSDIKEEQTFTAKYDGLNYIYINFYRGQKKCDLSQTVNIKIEEVDTGNVICEKNVGIKNLEYSLSYKVDFDVQKHSKDKLYKITVSYNTSTPYLPYFKNISDSTKVTMDGEQINEEIYLKIGYYNKEEHLLIITLVIILEIIVFLIASYILDKTDLKEETAFLLIVPMFCIIMSLVIPLGRGHDETVQFYREYGIVNGEILAGNQIMVPVALRNTFETIYSDSRLTNKSYLEILECNEQIDTNSKEYVWITTTSIYNPVQYTGTLVGLFLAKLITKTPIIFMYLGRLSNIVISVILLYKAIKMMPFGKKILLLASIIPIAIEGFSTLSSDGFTIAICYFFIAYILNLAFNKEIKILSKKHKIFIGVLSCIIACCKIVYFPLVLLILIIPKEKYGGLNEKVKEDVLVIFLTILINITWLIFGFSILISRGGESGSQTILEAIKNPIKFGQMVLYTINNNSNKYLLSAFGNQLEWGEQVDGTTFVIAFIALTTFITLTDESIKKKFSNKQKIVLGIVVIMIIGLIFCSLYVQWTQIESPEIQGVQGRYFIPIMPILLLLLGDIKVKSEYSSNKLTKMICLYSLIFLIYTMFILIISHL